MARLASAVPLLLLLSASLEPSLAAASSPDTLQQLRHAAKHQPNNPLPHVQLALALHELNHQRPDGGRRVPEAEQEYRYMQCMCDVSISQFTVYDVERLLCLDDSTLGFYLAWAVVQCLSSLWHNGTGASFCHAATAVNVLKVVLYLTSCCRKALSLISPDGEHAHIYMHVQGNLGALLLSADRPTEAITEFQAALTLGHNLEQQLQQKIQQLTTKKKKKGQKKQQQQQGLSELQQELQEVQQQLGGTLFNLGKALTSVGRYVGLLNSPRWLLSADLARGWGAPCSANVWLAALVLHHLPSPLCFPTVYCCTVAAAGQN